MRTRLQGLQRIAVVYRAMKHAQALALEQATAAVREAELLIAQQQMRMSLSGIAGREALDAGEDVAWRIHESQKQLAERSAERLAGLLRRREALMLEAAEVYRAGRMELEQMESVLRDLRLKLDVERAHSAQRESDDRFLSQKRWRERSAAGDDDGAHGA